MCGTLHPQYAGMFAATLSFVMYMAAAIYICVDGFWYAFGTILIAILCYGEFMFGAKNMCKTSLKAFITLAIIFEFALLALIATFIYFTLATEGDGTEYKVVVAVLSAFFVLNALCIRMMLVFSRFIRIFSRYLTQQGKVGSISEVSSSSVTKRSLASSVHGGSIIDSLPPKLSTNGDVEAQSQITGEDNTTIITRSEQVSRCETGESKQLEGYLNGAIDEDGSVLIKM
ncbi:unnamed protein product [Toxocara canis]|uniref:Uncharacterized protein n=1 Tax=Toxocara canis TaxID=6265 RepID=A0A3P7GRA4_TOXCA|nr:unnamed protein product [Toxocara canis]